MTPASKVILLLVFLLFSRSVYSQESQMVPQTSHVNGIKTAVLSPDDNYFFTSGFDYFINIWDYKNGKLLQNKKN
jgi:WD40 repeat protein